MEFPPLLSRDEIQMRLQAIFPEGTPNRTYCTRQFAASTVFVALYIGAIEGTGRFLGPKHVYRMTESQAELINGPPRLTYAELVNKPRGSVPGTRWYADNSREPIRDETLRDGFVAMGSFVERTDLATTSSKPRYALQREFAELFDPVLTGDALDQAIANWQRRFLAQGALARIALVRKGASAMGDQVMVKFPNGETRRLKPGQSSIITKAVIEEFAPRFLQSPAVVLLSESGNKVVVRDDELARSIGLQIRVDKDLPDMILVDIGPENPLLVFVEVVATDGPINERRKLALQKLATDAGFSLEHVAYLTAFHDRSGQPFKKNIDVLAWGSYAWFVSEPEGLIELSAGRMTL